MNRLSIMMIFLLLIFAASLPASAQNWRFLKYSPISSFTDEDWALLRSTGRDALDNQADGKTVSWKNPATDSSGEITLLKSFEKDGLPCRQVKMFNSAGGHTGTSNFVFCKIADGSWKVAQ